MTQKIVFRVIFPVGERARPISEKVSRRVSLLLRPWLEEALQNSRPLALPFPAARGFVAAARLRLDGLVVTLSRQFEDKPKESVQVATIGVAARAAALPSLCRHLAKVTGTLGPIPSGAPCCIVIPDVRRKAQFPEIGEWLEEFADGVSRAWLDLLDDGPGNPARGGGLGRGSDLLAA